MPDGGNKLNTRRSAEALHWAVRVLRDKTGQVGEMTSRDSCRTEKVTLGWKNLFMDSGSSGKDRPSCISATKLIN